MAHEENHPLSFSTARRLSIGFNVALSVVALLALVVMVNYLSARHGYRFAWAADAQHQITPQTRQVLRAVTNDIHVTVLFDRQSALYGLVTSLLKEYADACPKLSLEQVDYKRDLERANTLISLYQLPPTEADLVIFEANGRPHMVRATELSEYDLSGILAGEREVKRIGFKGEALFTSAIASLLDARVPHAYWLQGHKEHDIASTETGLGYSRFGQLLAQKNILVTPWRLVGDAEVPDDCQLLIIAGPCGRLDPAEVEKIKKYLNRGGRLLALLSYYRANYASIGLEKLLAAWGVAVGDNQVFDPNNSVLGGGLLCTNLTAHPIVKPLHGASIFVVLPRSVEPLRASAVSADAPQVETLFRTSVDGYTASDVTAGGVFRRDATRDRGGPISLAVAVEKGSIREIAADQVSTRMVVVGESVFLANETIDKATANLEFANLVVNWLLDRPTQVANIPPRPLHEYSIVLSRAQFWKMIWILLVVLPGAPLLAGLAVWVRRRR